MNGQKNIFICTTLPVTHIASSGRPFLYFPLYVQVLRGKAECHQGHLFVASTVEYYNRMSVVRSRIAASWYQSSFITGLAITTAAKSSVAERGVSRSLAYPMFPGSKLPVCVMLLRPPPRLLHGCDTCTYERAWRESQQRERLVTSNTCPHRIRHISPRYNEGWN